MKDSVTVLTISSHLCLLSRFLYFSRLSAKTKKSELKNGDEFLKLLTSSLDQIEEDDVGDFIDLAIQYRDLTPRTYLEEKIIPLFSGFGLLLTFIKVLVTKIQISGL